VVNGRPFPSKLAPRINKPGERVKSLGFAQTMEQTAYSWFNRIIVIRYMELHDYLGHGRRIEKLMLKGFAAECSNVTLSANDGFVRSTDCERRLFLI